MILDRLTEDMKTALKAGEKPRLSVIRMLISELKNARIAAGGVLEDAVAEKVVASYAKKRKEAKDAASEHGRNDLADKEQFEYDITMSYLPEQLGEAELRALVEKHRDASGASGPGAFGVLMKAVMAELAGRADGKVVSAIVRDVLG